MERLGEADKKRNKTKRRWNFRNCQGEIERLLTEEIRKELEISRGSTGLKVEWQSRTGRRIERGGGVAYGDKNMGDNQMNTVHL